jgi:hypothetical protein
MGARRIDPLYGACGPHDPMTAIINPFLYTSAGGGYVHLVDGSKAGGAGGVTTDAVDTSGATLIVVAATFYNGTPALSDSKGNAWTPLTSYPAYTGLYATQLFYCINPTVGSGHTFSLATSSYNSLIFGAFSKSSPVFDQAGGAGSTAGGFTTFQPGSLTPSVDGCLLFSSICWNLGGDGSIDSSFLSLDQVANTDVSSFRGRAAYKIQSSAGAENPTWTITTSSNSGGSSMAVFK